MVDEGRRELLELIPGPVHEVVLEAIHSAIGPKRKQQTAGTAKLSTGSEDRIGCNGIPLMDVCLCERKKKKHPTKSTHTTETLTTGCTWYTANLLWECGVRCLRCK